MATTKSNSKPKAKVVSMSPAKKGPVKTSKKK